MIFLFRPKKDAFAIIEILLTLVLIAIFALTLLPAIKLYIDKSRFQDVIRAAAALKPAVETCIIKTGSVDACTANANGIPENQTSFPSSAYVAQVEVSSGIITGTSTANLGSYTYILTPTYLSNKNIVWDVSGTCVAAGLCDATESAGGAPAITPAEQTVMLCQSSVNNAQSWGTWVCNSTSSGCNYCYPPFVSGQTAAQQLSDCQNNATNISTGLSSSCAIVQVTQTDLTTEQQQTVNQCQGSVNAAASWSWWVCTSTTSGCFACYPPVYGETQSQLTNVCQTNSYNTANGLSNSCSIVYWK